MCFRFARSIVTLRGDRWGILAFSHISAVAEKSWALRGFEIQLKDPGCTIREIAEALGVSRSLVHKSSRIATRLALQPQRDSEADRLSTNQMISESGPAWT